ncbi:hypothetical protein Rhopal_000759-T1 [Rhodotorula paludigena]|uniref:Uncharacterized protein n=1 Tax=Rhodotorula paludigena TaxID=86838 RepID=A0AAV5GBJ5_9BASI|nr:hypothetical protein Rhopal_000759-T1 [Rhodotorula paludigena]
MPCRYQLIDAFAREPFSGNPAAVVHLEAADPRVGDAAFMLNVAREYNLQETAFLVPLAAQDDGDKSVPRYSLRWFTPVQEFPLCGHATLASAHSLFSTKHPGATRLRFDTMSGTLEAEKLADGRIELDFPADVGVLDAANKDELKSLRSMAELAIPGSSDAIKHIALGKLGVIVQLDRAFDLQNASDEPAPEQPSPPSPGSTTSWPATEVGVSDHGGTSGTTSPARAASSDETLALESGNEASTPLAASVVEAQVTEAHLSNTAEETGTATEDVEGDLATPVSPTWSRSKLPVSDDDEVSLDAKKATGSSCDQAMESTSSDNAASPSPVANNTKTSNEPQKAQHDEDKSPTPTTATRPAFVLTRPTLGGENEQVSISQPSTPSVKSAKDATSASITAEQSRSAPTIQIQTFLPETKQFFASPTTTNIAPNSAVSPRTHAFFTSNFAPAPSAPRSPPRSGGAFITELSSDAEVVQVSVQIQEAVSSDFRAPLPIKAERPASPSPIEFVPRRTVVSSAVPRLVRAESLRQQHIYRRTDRRPSPQPPRAREQPVPRRRGPNEERPREPRPAQPQHRRNEISPLGRLVRDLKLALADDPAAFYVLKGVLVEHEERIRRDEPPYSSPPPRSKRDERRDRRDVERQQPFASSRRAGVSSTRLASRNVKIVPMPHGWLDPSDSDETEVEKVHPAKLKTPNAFSSSAFSTARRPLGRRSPAPDYPQHLSPKRSSRPVNLDLPRPPQPPPLFRPVPTLTMAQAAKLAEGLGDGRLADELRHSGLHEKDKVTRLDARNGGDGRGRSSDTRDHLRGGGETLARRHSFDSVVDYKPASERHPAKKQDKGNFKRAASDAQKVASSRLPPYVPRPHNDSGGMHNRVVHFFGSSLIKPIPSHGKPALGLNMTATSHAHCGHDAVYPSPSTRTPSHPIFSRTAPPKPADKGKERAPAGATTSKREDSISFDFDDFA